MLRMVVFDFDGVITDSERGHFETLREVLRMRGIRMNWQSYCDKYLAYDDRECFIHAFKDSDRQISPGEIEELIARKRVMFEEYQTRNRVIFPGVKKLLADLLANEIICAICSGSCRSEIEYFLKHTDLRDYFKLIISSDDVQASKPDPQGYQQSVVEANRLLGVQAVTKPEKSENDGNSEIRPDECVAVEDSIGGITSAKGAGMYCLAVTNSYPAERLREADLVVEDLSRVDTEFLRQLLN